MAASHRTAMGKPIDMAALRTSNEHVRAIGNMNVNSRGDMIDNHNNVVEPISQRVNRLYTKMSSTPKIPEVDKSKPPLPERVVEHPRLPIAETVTAQKMPPVIDLFEELSESEMELDSDHDITSPAPVKSKKSNPVK